MEIHFSSHFLKAARKLTKHDQIQLSQCIELFRRNPFAPKLKTHALTGSMRGIWSFSVSYKIRVTYGYVNPKTALFFDVGSHGEVYR